MYAAIAFDAKYKGVGTVELAKNSRSEAEKNLKRDFPDTVFDQIVIVVNGPLYPDIVDAWIPGVQP